MMSLTQKLSENIISYILKEQLMPGDKLPNESILSEKLDAGRSSIREAMKLLESRNIVTIRQGSGTYIAHTPGVVEGPLGFTFIEDKRKLVMDLMEVRFLMEPGIAAMAATHADENDIKKISALCNEVESLIRSNSSHAEKDIEFHTAIAMSSKNIVVPRLIPIINSSIPLFIHFTHNQLLHETIETHHEITQAIAAHNALGAKDAMYLHLIYNQKELSQMLN
jgi:GntR family transcriptional repressor for pyruvate dehydrogenase complex